MSDILDISIVTVSFNSPEDLEVLLKSIAPFLNERVQLFIVDNNSDIRTKRFLKDISIPFVKIIFLNENVGFGNANNVIFQSIKSRYYFLLNLDAYVNDDSFKKCMDLCENNPNIGIIGLPLIYPDGTRQSYFYSFSSARKWLLQLLPIHSILNFLSSSVFFKWLLFPVLNTNYYKRHFTNEAVEVEKVCEVDWVCGAAMFVTNDLINSTSGFDPNIFLYGEDEDLCLQAHSYGYSVVTYQVEPIVHKFGWGTSGKANKVVSRLKYQSLKYFIEKHTRSKVKLFFRKAILPLHVYGIKFFFEQKDTK